MGYFDDVRAEIEPFEGGIKLIYVVKEKPTIVKIEFQGNKEFDDAKLKEKLTITTGAIADAVLIQDNANKLRAFYEEEGYWLSRIVPVVKTISPDEISLTYQIEEGPKMKIKKINIEGNKAISAKQDKEGHGDERNGGFSPSLLRRDIIKKTAWILISKKLRDLYFNNGYIKVAVGEPKTQLTEDKKGMVITIPISEGDQYRLSSVEFSGNKIFGRRCYQEKDHHGTGQAF